MSEKSKDEKGESKDTSKDTPVPKNIDKLLKKEKKGDISYEEREELFSFLETVDNIQSLVRDDPYNFSDTEYNRMMKSKVRHGSRQRAGKALKDAEGTLKGQQSEDFSDFLKDFWAQANDIGTRVVQKYTSRASELGYYDEELEAVDMRGFTEDAIEFYTHERPLVEQRKQTIKAYQVTFQVVKMMLNRQRESIQKLAMFTLQLAQEHDVPMEELTPVRGLLNQVVGGENLARQKGR